MSYNLGSAVNPIKSYANLAAFPAVGVSDSEYVDLSNGRIYLWQGSAYVEKSKDLITTTATLTSLAALTVADCADVVTVTADGTGGQFRKDATVVTGDGAMTVTGWRRIITNHVDVRWFGAKGDARFRKNSDGTWYQDGGLTVAATDNTSAFKAAYDWCLATVNSASAYDTSAPNTTTFGYQTRLYSLYIAGGNYYCNSATDMFTSSRVAFGGARSAIKIHGDGKWTSMIHVRQTTPAVNDYVVRLDMYEPMFQDLTFVGCTGNEQLLDYSFFGNSQNLMMRNVGLRRFKQGIRISGANGNCDKTTWINSCIWTNTPGATFFGISDVSQSVAHTMTGGDHYIEGVGSVAFRLAAGGPISVHGGSWEVHGGATLDKIAGPNALISGQLQPNISWYGVKFECHDNSVYDDIGNGGSVLYTGCSLTINTTNTGNPKHVIREFGTVTLENTNVAEFRKLAVLSNNGSAYAAAHRAQFKFRDCILPDDFISTALTNYDATQAFNPFSATPGTVFASANTAGLGRISATGCRHELGASVGSGTLFAANGSPNDYLGYSTLGAEIQTIRHAGYPNPVAGLPSVSVNLPGVVKLPIGCILRAVRIVKTGNNQAGAGASQGWQVKDGNGVVWAVLQLSGDQIKTETVHVGNVLLTNNERTFTLSPLASNTDHYAPGFFELEYC